MSIFPTDLLQSARLLLDDAQARGIKIATAESCTGGLVAALLTEIAAHPQQLNAVLLSTQIKPNRKCWVCLAI